jgi:hypothetical protein
VTNFGETIAYRYLRLQGFLLADDFVLHSGDRIGRTAGHDLLALRLKHSQEKVDGQMLQADGALETQLAAIGRNVTLIVQVKTGHETAPGRAFERARLEYAIGFLGVVPPDLVNGLAGKLAEKPSVEFSTDWTIAKLWVAEEPTNSGALSVTLQAALKFICARLASHTERKYADRLMFPDDLMQFFAWQARKATNAAE